VEGLFFALLKYKIWRYSFRLSCRHV